MNLTKYIKCFSTVRVHANNNQHFSSVWATWAVHRSVISAKYSNLHQSFRSTLWIFLAWNSASTIFTLVFNIRFPKRWERVFSRNWLSFFERDLESSWLPELYQPFLWILRTASSSIMIATIIYFAILLDAVIRIAHICAPMRAIKRFFNHGGRCQ